MSAFQLFFNSHYPVDLTKSTNSDDNEESVTGNVGRMLLPTEEPEVRSRGPAKFERAKVSRKLGFRKVNLTRSGYIQPNLAKQKRQTS